MIPDILPTGLHLEDWYSAAGAYVGIVVWAALGLGAAVLAIVLGYRLVKSCFIAWSWTHGAGVLAVGRRSRSPERD